MVRVLIALRASVNAHRWQRSSRSPLILALALGVLSAWGTLALGFVHGQAADDVLSVVFALWLGGQVAQAALNGGDAGVRPEMLALLPLPPRRLAWSLLVVGLADPVLVLLLTAYAALVPAGFRLGAAAGLVGVVSAVLTTLMTAVLATIAGGVLGPGARRGRDIGTVVTALALAGLALAGTLAPSVVDAFEHGHARWLRDLVRVLPTGWGVNAVEAAGRGDGAAAIAWSAGLLVVLVLASVCWPAILLRRMTAGPPAAHGSTGSSRGRFLPSGPIGAVMAKELRLWARDPVRLTCLLIALVVGAGVAVLPRLTAHTGLLMPFAGPLTVVIAGAVACNLYGNDGTALWLTVMTPGGSRADVRGRLAAWALVVAPFTVIETVVLTALSGQPDRWPWALSLEIALVGGAAGIIPLASLTAVQPLDEAGNPTPGWSVKVHVALLVVAATALPALALLIAGAGTHTGWLTWASLPVALATGVLLTVTDTRLASERLRLRQVSVLAQLAAAA